MEDNQMLNFKILTDVLGKIYPIFQIVYFGLFRATKFD